MVTSGGGRKDVDGRFFSLFGVRDNRMSLLLCKETFKGSTGGNYDILYSFVVTTSLFFFKTLLKLIREEAYRIVELRLGLTTEIKKINASSVASAAIIRSRLGDKLIT
ncbi:hypothetical protein BDZ85DRAFT_246910 [Elsinoe ampelina]|uniref:Uncharacterized protein n=1 Tax=Elsinoe ampelina TaxID=302913 RepID=A0A6A6GL47_9PEZI|nr:hypothetical protein BDZ85DRAFT_246910 [Elsinoe ampelina]